MIKLYLYARRYLSVLLVCLSLGAFAQQTVTGKITASDDGSPIPGANVLEKGTTNGTVSDSDGNFKISVGANSTLVISFVGYVTQEVAVGSQSNLSISLQSDVTSLSEVVVIGYGQVEAKDATGAIVSLKSTDFNGGVISSPEQLMQGRVAGVQIAQTSGEPGAAQNIRIRGTSSIVNGNNPLYVVDGVPLSNDDVSAVGSVGGAGQSAPRNPLNFMNPNDIENITVLKDASATAIYGSRGANGVVLITTKRGKSGKASLEYAYSASVANISKKYDLLSPDAFVKAWSFYNNGSTSIDRGARTDWQDAVLQTAYTQNHTISYGGGDKSSDYRFSGSYMDQQGIVKTSSLNRFTLRFNGSKKFIDDKLTISTSFTVATTRDGNVPITTNSGFEGDLWGNALKANPTAPIYNPDGTFYQLSNTEPNPVAMIRLSNSYTNTIRALGNLSAEYEIIKGLKFKTVYGFDRSISERKSAFSRLLNVTQIYGLGRLYLNQVEVDNKLWENYLTYNKTFGNITFDGLLGYSYQSFGYVTQGAAYSNFRTDDPTEMINNLASSDQSKLGSAVGTNSSNTTDELQSYYGRFVVGMKDKYLLTATLRADGSTRFGGDNKYGYFPSIAFKWRMKEESFVPESISDLSFRIGYGVTGNQQIPHNIYTSRQRFGDASINDGANNINNGSLQPVAFANPNLKWEATAQFNAGFDFGFLNNRLTGSIDFYRKNTTNMLIPIVIAQPASNPFIYQNLPGSVINQGFEVVLNYAAIQKTDFRWNISANAAYNHNEVQDFPTFYNGGTINGQGLSGAYSQRTANGEPLFAYYVRVFKGFDSNGIAQYDGGDVQKFVGKSPLPSWNIGFTNNFNYKNWDMNIFFTGQLGQYVYSNTANAFFTAGSLANGRNVTTDIVGNGENKLNAPDVSTRFLYDASFMRLQNVTIGYNWNLNKSAISKLRFYVTGQNLFVITSYPFQDPEVNIQKIGSSLSAATVNLPSAGIDYTAYPRARTFTFGINATF